MSILRYTLFSYFLTTVFFSQAQLTPVVTHWLQNDSLTGKYYLENNFTPIDNGILANCQQVAYSPNWVYISTNGIPAYPTGPFLGGNTSQAIDQNRIIKLTRHPEENTESHIPTTPGNIGMFINGVSLYDFRDGVAWNPATQSLCGGVNMPPCPGGQGASLPWNRIAVNSEVNDYDCSKGHPASGNYHHHQNPIPFNADLNVISDICDLYPSTGLYNMDSTLHSPLIGFAYDGFPIYGSFGYANTDGTGEITRMKSSYQLRNILLRNTSPSGSSVGLGPVVSATYPLGYFREDYEYVAHPDEQDYLDEHNGRFCITPDYPNGTYAYFCTIDENWNSVYPYVVGPTFFGIPTGTTVFDIDEPTQIYVGTDSIDDFSSSVKQIRFYPNPAQNQLNIEFPGLHKHNLKVNVYDLQGRKIAQTNFVAGQSSTILDFKELSNGQYLIEIWHGDFVFQREKIVVSK